MIRVPDFMQQFADDRGQFGMLISEEAFEELLHLECDEFIVALQDCIAGIGKAATQHLVNTVIDYPDNQERVTQLATLAFRMIALNTVVRVAFGDEVDAPLRLDPTPEEMTGILGWLSDRCDRMRKVPRR